MFFSSGFGGGDPFDHFGGRMPQQRGPPAKVDNETYYKVLGVAKTAEDSEIKKAYRNLARTHHPDRGGDPEKFKEIQEAHEVLSDPEKRKNYDKYGKEGAESGAGGGGDAEDILSQFFGGGARGPRGPKKGEDKEQELKVSLEDLYNGKTTKLAINRKKPCTSCEGRGGKVGAEKSCSDCNGKGMVVRVIRQGNMIQQIQQVCPTCKGNRMQIDERDKCTSCRGLKTCMDRKIIEVAVEKGMINGQKIKFSGESDEIPGTIPGDIVIQLSQKPHDLFQRRGADLLCKLDITLSEALCGFVKTITHLDGRILKIEKAAGVVTKQDALCMIHGEGMPHHGNPFTKGRLFINFKIDFPKTLPPNVIQALNLVLPKPVAPTLKGDEDDCDLVDVDMNQFGLDKGDSHHSSSATGGDDDDEGGQGGQPGVQCRQG